MRTESAVLVVAVILALGLGCESIRPRQSDEPLRSQQAELGAWVQSRPHAPQGSEVRVPVDADDADRFALALRELALGNASRAAREAASVGYEVIEIRDSGSRYRILAEVGGQGVGPLVMLSMNPTRDLIAEAAHSTFESGTGAQAISLVTSTGARAAILAGAHRCASTTPSGCDGKTLVCNKDFKPPRVPYVDSDVAHNPATLFHAAHRTLADLWPDAVVVQLHGMGTGRPVPKGQESRPPDEWTWFIASSGVDAAAPRSPLSVQARDALRTRAPGGDVRAVSCQDPSDKQRFQHRNLCGTKNVQNRYLLGQPNVCTSGTTEMAPRFLHVEQRFDPVLNDAAWMGLIVEALKDVVPERSPGQLR